MKKFKFSKVSIIVLAVAFTLGLGGIIAVRAVVAIGDLGAATNYSVWGATGITGGTGSGTTAWGSAGENNTGNDDTLASKMGGNYPTGTYHQEDQSATVGAAITAQRLALNGATVTGTVDLASANVAVGPGVYDVSTTAFTKTLTLNGAGTYIFKRLSSNIAQNTGGTMILNGACASDIYWDVGTDMAFAVGTGINMYGTIIAGTTIAFGGSGLTLQGRALTDTSVTFGGFTINITNPTCTGTLNVIKVVNGPAHPADFLVHVYGPTGGEVSESPQVGAASPGTPYVLSAATYTVGETGGPANYTTSFSGNCDGSNSVIVNAGLNPICTITNTIIPYTLHVYKQVVGGTAIPSDFSLSVKLSGTNVTGSPQNGDSSGTSYTLFSNTTYVVSEVANASYTQSFSGDCDSSGSVTLNVDGKTCTITNTYHTSSGGGGYIRPVFSPFINIISTPVVIAPAPIIPKLPKTGFPPEEKSTTLPIVLLSGLSLVSIFLYFAQKKQTT